MTKVLLTRNQCVEHVFYKAGEIDVDDKVAAELKRRGALGETPKVTPAASAALEPSKNSTEVKN